MKKLELYGLYGLRWEDMIEVDHTAEEGNLTAVFTSFEKASDYEYASRWKPHRRHPKLVATNQMIEFGEDPPHIRYSNHSVLEWYRHAVICKLGAKLPIDPVFK